MKFSNYTSELSQFLDSLKKDKPHIEAGQQTGRNLLWDKAPLNLREMEGHSPIKHSAYIKPK